MKPSVLIVEDEAGIAESLIDWFELEGHLVSSASTLDEAREKTRRPHGFDLIVLDLMLGNESGLDLLENLRASGDQTPVIITTALGQEEHRVRGLDLGADDYLVKPFGLDELGARVRAVLRRAPPAQGFRIGEDVIDLEAHCVVHSDGERERLLQREVDLLAYLLRARGRTVSRAELLREVWGYRSAPRTRTVDTHVFNLRKKLATERSTPRHLLTVHGVGYRLDVGGEATVEAG